MTDSAIYKIPESVLVVIHTLEREVLLLQRADMPEAWQSVTGAKDTWDEPWAVTATREVMEETGIDVQAPGCTLTDWRQENQYAIYPQWRHRYAPGTTHNTERVFGLCVPQAQAIRLNPREHLAFRWLMAEQAAALCFSASNAEAIRRGLCGHARCDTMQR